MSELLINLAVVGVAGALGTFIGLRSFDALGNPYGFSPERAKRIRRIALVTIWSVIVVVDCVVLALTL